MAMTKRVYLAGPEVFLADAREIGAHKRAICARHGLVGVFPADEEEACDPALPLAEQGLAISRAMERVMRAVPRSRRRVLWGRAACPADWRTRGFRRHGDRAVRTAR
jgi:hypothetical protein